MSRRKESVRVSAWMSLDVCESVCELERVGEFVQVCVRVCVGKRSLKKFKVAKVDRWKKIDEVK